MTYYIKKHSNILFTNIITSLNNNKHIQEKKTTYFNHMKTSFFLSTRMFYGGIALFIHSIFPNIFEKTGSDTIKKLYKEIN